MRITLIHNPAAGHDGPTDDELIDAVKRAGHAVDYHPTTSKHWIHTLETPGDLVVAAGGDGTVAKVAAALDGRDVPMAILPIGTANNVATSLGIRGSFRDLIDGWTSASRHRFDLGLASGPWGQRRFLEAVGLGLFTQAMALANTQNDVVEPDGRHDEIARDLRLLQMTLSSCRARPMRIRMDDEDLTGEYFLLEVLNVPCFGPNLRLAPQAKVGDRTIDLVLLGEGERDLLHDYLDRRAAGEQVELDVPVRRGRLAQLDWDGLPLHVDDQIFADARRAEEGGSALVEVRLAGAVEVLVGGVGSISGVSARDAQKLQK